MSHVDPTGALAPGDGGARATSRWSRAVDFVAIALYGAFVLATAVLAYAVPLVGDDYEALRVLRIHPGITSWISYWYTQVYGRLPGMLAYYVVIQSRLAFAILVGLTLPLTAFLVLGVALGRRPTIGRRDLFAVGFLTAALWFSLPLQWDVFWRTGWPYAALPALLMLAFILPYRVWLQRLDSAEPPTRSLLSAAGMLVLGAAAADSHESVLVVLVVLGVAFVWFALRHHAQRAVPLQLWAGLTGLVVGGMVLLAAPGNRVRAASTGGMAMSLGTRLGEDVIFTGRTFFIWLSPAYPWLLCLLVATLAIGVVGRTPGKLAKPWPMSVVWLSAAVVAGLPFLAFPEVADQGGARTVIFAALLLFVAAGALLVPEASDHVLDRLPHLAATVALAGLLIVTIGDVGVNLHDATGIDAELSARAQLVAQQEARGNRTLVLPHLHHGDVGTSDTFRAILWGDVGENRDDWVNKAVASYYGAESVVTTSTK